MKALLISLILAINPANVRTETGFIVNAETIETGENLWCYDTEIAAGTPVVVYFDTLGTETIYDDVIFRVDSIR